MPLEQEPPLPQSDYPKELVLVELNPQTDPRWDAFVTNHPLATVYHHSAWTRVLIETFGHTPLFLGLLAPQNGRLQGALPFVFINSMITGRRLVALPCSTHCNPLVPEAHLEEMLCHALSRFRGAGYVELKLLKKPGEIAGPAQADRESGFVSQVLSLDQNLEELFRSFHDSSIRQRVRRAARAGLAFRLAESESELRQFFQMYLAVRRGEGLPCFPYGFFENMRRILEPLGLFELPVIEYEQRIVAAAVVLKGRSAWHLEYMASDDSSHRLGSNQLLIWECIRRAHNSGAKVLDFGRTSLRHQSLLEFKDRWHTERCPIYYRYYPNDVMRRRRQDSSAGLIVRLNRRLPTRLLEWEGRLIYPHRS
jgi:CelD/BcsL family acetyltransferase involved in cellulose biosynthesis